LHFLPIQTVLKNEKLCKHWMSALPYSVYIRACALNGSNPPIVARERNAPIGRFGSWLCGKGWRFGGRARGVALWRFLRIVFRLFGDYWLLVLSDTFR